MADSVEIECDECGQWRLHVGGREYGASDAFSCSMEGYTCGLVTCISCGHDDRVSDVYWSGAPFTCDLCKSQLRGAYRAVQLIAGAPTRADRRAQRAVSAGTTLSVDQRSLDRGRRFQAAPLPPAAPWSATVRKITSKGNVLLGSGGTGGPRLIVTLEAANAIHGAAIEAEESVHTVGRRSYSKVDRVHDRRRLRMSEQGADAAHGRQKVQDDAVRASKVLLNRVASSLASRLASMSDTRAYVQSPGFMADYRTYQDLDVSTVRYGTVKFAVFSLLRSDLSNRAELVVLFKVIYPDAGLDTFIAGQVLDRQRDIDRLDRTIAAVAAPTVSSATDVAASRRRAAAITALQLDSPVFARRLARYRGEGRTINVELVAEFTSTIDAGLQQQVYAYLSTPGRDLTIDPEQAGQTYLDRARGQHERELDRWSADNPAMDAAEKASVLARHTVDNHAARQQHAATVRAQQTTKRAQAITAFMSDSNMRTIVTANQQAIRQRGGGTIGDYAASARQATQRVAADKSASVAAARPLKARIASARRDDLYDLIADVNEYILKYPLQEESAVLIGLLQTAIRFWTVVGADRSDLLAMLGEEAYRDPSDDESGAEDAAPSSPEQEAEGEGESTMSAPPRRKRRPPAVAPRSPVTGTRSPAAGYVTTPRTPSSSESTGSRRSAGYVTTPSSSESTGSRRSAGYVTTPELRPGRRTWHYLG